MTAPISGRVRAKVCGLTRTQDIQAAVRSGADAIGLVFYPGSRRAVSIEQAVALRAQVPAFVSVVALFVNAPQAEVHDVIAQVQPDLLQFHGDESAAYCEAFGHRYVRAFRVGGPDMASAEQVLAACRRYMSASAWLFDSHSAGYGGSGRALDPALLDYVLQAPDSRPVVLAGGLRPDTVAQSIRTIRPYAVDVSSGVEAAPGIKSAEQIAAFIRAVQGGIA